MFLNRARDAVPPSLEVVAPALRLDAFSLAAVATIVERSLQSSLDRKQFLLKGVFDPSASREYASCSYDRLLD